MATAWERDYNYYIHVHNHTLTLDGGVGESLRVCGTIHVTIPTVACCSADDTCATPSIAIIIPTTAGEAVRVWFTYLRAILICGGQLIIYRYIASFPGSHVAWEPGNEANGYIHV